PRSRIALISCFLVSGSALNWNGNPSSPTEAAWPGTAVFGAVTASASEPRATTPSGNCLIPPSRYALNLGLSCISWRQAETEKAVVRQTPSPNSFNLFFDIGHLFRPQAFEKGASLRRVVSRIVRFDAQKEPVLRRAGEARHIEDR